MMRSPDGKTLFVEVCKTGSTACATMLRNAGWWQNGSKGTKRIPGTGPGRHAYLTPTTAHWMADEGVIAYGVVRNPWDRMASLWRASAPGTQSFWDYMNRGRFKVGGVDGLTFTQTQWLAHVDRVLRYETLERDWAQHTDGEHALPNGALPVVNRSKRRDAPHWTQREIDIVAQRFADDIETYGYEGPS